MTYPKKHILLQINVTANWGSTGKIAESIGIAAMNAGWDSYVAYGRWCNPSQSHLIKIGGKCDMYFHYVEQRVRDNEGLCSRGATQRLIKQIEQIKPDIVQLHNIHDHYLNYRLLFEFLNKSGVKVVWTFHDCWAFTGHCFHFVTKQCMRWQSGCYCCPMKNVLPKTFLDRSKQHYELKKLLFSSNKNLTVVPCSDWMAGFVKQSFLKDKRIEVIKNGIDLNVFQPAESDIKKNNHKLDILAVSSVWTEDKGFNDIIRLRFLLPSEYHITMVGLSAEQRKLLPEGIRGILRTENVQEMVKLYSDSSVLINPTYADTFPSINLEALACGTPVVTYKTGGSPETIDDKTGIVVEQGDIEAMAEAIKTISKGDRSQYAVDCRKRAELFFDKDKCFEKYVRLYNQLLS